MKYVIIGTGPAGVIAAETLRKQDAAAEIVLIGNEPEPPYSRMALPYYLVGNIDEKGTYLRKSTDHFKQLQIEIVQQTVSSVRSDNQSLLLSNQENISYDRLLLATGSSPFKPPIRGIDLPGIYNCWTLADARSLFQSINTGTKVVLLGAGFIGCIILEALVKRGADLTVIEMGDRMVPRMMNEKAGNLIKQWCIDKGIKVLTDTKVIGIDQNQDNSLSIETDDGRLISANTIVSAVGVKANIDFLAGSGIKTEQGILVNRYMQTNIDSIFAAGDVAQGLDFSTGEYSVQAIQPTAAEHAQIAAKNMFGEKVHIPHRGSLNMNVLDTLGLISSSFGLWMGIAGGDATELYDPDNYRYINLQFRDDVLIGATSIGLTQHVGVLKGLIQSQCKLGSWKHRLMDDPSRIMEAYLAHTLPLS
jgi:NAD(P)H-nitrite reductase large subunit